MRRGRTPHPIDTFAECYLGIAVVVALGSPTLGALMVGIPVLLAMLFGGQARHKPSTALNRRDSSIPR